jgi:hypothetical protein
MMTGAQVCLDDFRLKLEAQLAPLALAQLRLIRLQHRRPGAYTVRTQWRFSVAGRVQVRNSSLSKKDKGTIQPSWVMMKSVQAEKLAPQQLELHLYFIARCAP